MPEIVDRSVRPKPFKKAEECQRVFAAVIQQRLPSLVAFDLIQIPPHQRFPSQPSILPVCDGHSFIGQLWHESRQNGFQRVLPRERGMVDMVSDDGKQVPETSLD